MAASRKPWYVVEVHYETIGGDIKTVRTEPMREHGTAMRIMAEYKETGHRAEVIAVPAPPTKAQLAKKAEKVGSH